MSDIDEVKARTNIIDVIGARVTLRKAGRHFKALCPFHSEKTPSFIVSPERQMWKCFGCGRGGSAIDFVMEYEHVDFMEALTTLAEKAGVTLTRRAADTPHAQLKEKIYAVNHLASEFYHYLLTKHAIGEKARTYLKTRGVTEKAMKTFALGYSPNSWDGLLTYLKKKGYDEKLLDQAGLILLSPRGGYDRFRGRVMFPLKDHRGNIVGFSGRLLDPQAKEAKYVNTSETPVYSKRNVLYGLDVTKDAIKRENEAVLVEGEFDVISSFQAGVSNVVAIKGSALTEGHVHLLRRFTNRLVFALDSDLAGDSAARRGIEIADQADLDIRVASLPMGKDPDEAARENAALFKKALSAAVPIYDYLIASAIRRFDIKDPFGKRKAGEELLPVVAKIDNPIVQSHYIKKLAEVFDVSEDAVAQGMRKIAHAARVSRRDEAATTSVVRRERSRQENLELYILAILLQGRTVELWDDVQGIEWSVPAVRRIMEQLGQYLNENPVFLIRDFADGLAKELLPTLDEAFLWDIADILEDEEKCAKSWASAIVELKREILRRKIAGNENAEELRHLTQELKKLENLR